MPITPSSILHRSTVHEIAAGHVVAVGVARSL